MGRGLGEETRIETDYYGTQVRGDSNLDTSEVKKSEEVRNRPGVNIIQKQNKPGLLLYWVGGMAPTSPRPDLRKV